MRGRGMAIAGRRAGPHYSLPANGPKATDTGCQLIATAGQRQVS
jgi:hypothetical protein